jgi:tetratricopeptide (TPR) repeat protein
MGESRRATMIIALFVFLAAAVVYFATLAPTVPFWDSGEFIAVSYILGVPHPPGTPFYVLLGRIATLIPWATVAQRVNGMSALASSFTVMFTYLCGLKIIRLAQGSERRAEDGWIAHLGAVTGALMFAYSDSFWENSIEAEVYSLMSLAQILVFWLGLRWWEEHERKPTAGPLLLCVYLMWLSVGLHLGVAIMGLPLMVLVALVDRRAAVVFAMPLLSSLFVTMGLERMAGAVLVLGTLTLAVYAWQRKLNGWVAAVSAAAAIWGMVPAFGDADFTRGTASLAAASLLVPMLLLARKAREGRILALALALMVVGYSTHLYLPIRAARHPAVNEGNPSDWSSLRDLLERKQYGATSMFERRAPLAAQLNKEFWRYFRRQWPLAHTPRLWGAMLPLLLGLVGGWWLARRERNSFFYTGSFLGLTTAGMIVFLNFTDHEVRERDYFFQSGYHAYALWIGAGVAFAILWIRDSFSSPRTRRIAAYSTATLLAFQPVLLLRTLWFTHDESRNYIAHDYAYNMLAPLAPGSYVYTNGDNDTFPLWYMQQVEDFRKDVRVVNLSLLNTDWYIKQLRDEEPKVPITLSDAVVKMLGRGLVQDSAGRVVYTNEFMVQHITDESRLGADRWKKQPYFAVTVPEHMGLEPYFTLEGLVYRVNRDSLEGQVDEPATRNALYRTFKYRGLFKADGSWDSTVYKDENASTLTRNYAAAHLQLAVYYRKQRKLDDAIAEMERVSRMFPDYVEVQIPLGGFYLDKGDTAKALALFQRLSVSAPSNPEARYYHGVLLVGRGELEAGVKELDAAIQLDPDYNLAYYAAYSLLWEHGLYERSLGYLEKWLQLHPNDSGARALLDKGRGSPGNAPKPPPPPRMPGLP